MKGFVPTPERIVDLMVEKLFRDLPPRPDSRILDPGCGRGAFIDGIVRWCAARSLPLPVIAGIESDPQHFAVASGRFSDIPQVQIFHSDFLVPSGKRFDYVVGNPPYVPITGLSEAERSAYRATYAAARGRFDLYLLFFEQALALLTSGGRLVFITPEKYLYVDTARALRAILSRHHVEELHFLDERTFPDLVTYPLVSSIVARPGTTATRVLGRHGNVSTISLAGRDSSWLPVILGAADESIDLRLADVCTRISCGVATGADSVFVVKTDRMDPGLRAFSRPTISGRQLGPTTPLAGAHSLLLPYAESGALLREDELGSLGLYLNEASRRQRLLGRTCVARKPWYAFHETPPMAEMLKPKLLCKDITASPFFIPDRHGEIVPRHSVYYVIPSEAGRLDDLAAYLNSATAQAWLRANCQRAANGFLRLQSHVLKKLPVPVDLLPAGAAAQPAERRSRSA